MANAPLVEAGWRDSMQSIIFWFPEIILSVRLEAGLESPANFGFCERFQLVPHLGATLPRA
jgi:hypothetical protein